MPANETAARKAEPFLAVQLLLSRASCTGRVVVVHVYSYLYMHATYTRSAVLSSWMQHYNIHHTQQHHPHPQPPPPPPPQHAHHTTPHHTTFCRIISVQVPFPRPVYKSDFCVIIIVSYAVTKALCSSSVRSHLIPIPYSTAFCIHIALGPYRQSAGLRQLCLRSGASAIEWASTLDTFHSWYS